VRFGGDGEVAALGILSNLVAGPELPTGPALLAGAEADDAAPG
jgi:hypothetical protein